MAGIDLRAFESPDEVRAFEHGRFEVVRIGGMVVGRATYEPGWRWSRHVGGDPDSRCQVEHVGLVVSGRAAILMDDGEERVMEPGELFHVAAGHDSWVVGDEPYVSLHFLGAGDYAA
jgi:quercetin dioxygenase-like cupin family protein